MLDGWFRHRLLDDVMFLGVVWDADTGGTAKFKQLRVTSVSGYCFLYFLSPVWSVLNYQRQIFLSLQVN